MDIAVRAHLHGWKMIFLNDVVVLEKDLAHQDYKLEVQLYQAQITPLLLSSYSSPYDDSSTSRDDDSGSKATIQAPRQRFSPQGTIQAMIQAPRHDSGP
ncbi:hypothetical protein Ccrd_020431 [Cynara cardunculus var. scolymus]|uniref:Uncharacterized protein n=1 Tax=Cynara cardunculus var. scolymus TaxID=59895 RepID=A0A103Y2H7_CYNCS|nr:hypothetical protein Ccrd_020431 [Cynara cardunculus var. scolymus]